MTNSIIENLFKQNFSALEEGDLGALAKFRGLDAKTLNKIFESFDSTRFDGKYFFRSLASNPNCPADVLYKIYDTVADPALAPELANNPNCPPDVLKHIYKSYQYSNVWDFLSRNPKCPEDVLWDLANMGDWRLSEAVVANGGCSLELLEKIKEKGIITTYSALKNPNQPKEYLGTMLVKGNEIHRKYIAENRACDSGLLDQVSLVGDMLVLSAVSRHPNLSSETIGRLLSKNAKNFYVGLASCVNCSDEQFKEIFENSPFDMAVHAALSKNPNCPVEVLENVLNVHRKADVRIQAECLVNLLGREKVKVSLFQEAAVFVENYELNASIVHVSVAYALSEKLHNLHQFSPGEASFIVDYVEEKFGFKTPYKLLNVKLNKDVVAKKHNVNLGF